MSNVYVFRINYKEWYSTIREELLTKGLLRQGWGGYDMQIDRGYESFKAGWQNHWEKDLPDKTMRSKFNNLSKMLEIEPGDYIVIPKISSKKDYICQDFVIAKCKSKYRFSVLEDAKDFGHIIEVEDCISCGYQKNIWAQNIKSKFIAYQSPLNKVKSVTFIQAVETLVKLKNEKPDEFEIDSPDIVSMIGYGTRTERQPYLESIKTTLQNIGNKEFEKVIGELFEKNGYALIDTNWFDGEGGDVDLIFEGFGKDTLMFDIYSSSTAIMPNIYVQAKKKTGNDAKDIIGVEQLIKMKESISESNSILMVINLTDRFTEGAKTLAEDEGVILVDGMTFASLLVRYGIDVAFA